MVSYDYYVNTYLGSLIPEKVFPERVRQAQGWLDKFCRRYLVEGGEDARAMALCSMAEEIHRTAGHQGVASTSIGGVRVQYRDNGERQLEGCLLRRAGVYLEFYRGRDLCASAQLHSV